MKNRFFFFTLVFISCFVRCNDEKRFLEANDFYKKSDFEKAAQVYESIDNKSASVWYNLGNTYFNLQQYPEAIWAWKNAKGFGDSDFNISLLEKSLEIESEQSFIDKHWFLFQLSFLLFLYLLFGIYLCVNSKVLRRRLLFFIILFDACIISITFFKEGKFNTRQAILKVDSDIFAGPNFDYHVVGSISEGRTLSIVNCNEAKSDHSGDDVWYKVADLHTKGWITKEKLLMV